MAPFIVIEGLDGVGKTSLAAALTAELGATALHTPPQEMAAVRPFFDKQPPHLRRKYYELGNHTAAEQVSTLLGRGETVVLDRYWTSTIAYSALDNVTRTGGNDNSSVVPSVQPTHWVYMRLNESTRRERIRRRADAGDGVGATTVAETNEEKRLRSSEDKARTVEDGYKQAYAILRGLAPDSTCVVLHCDGRTVAELTNAVATLVRDATYTADDCIQPFAQFLEE